MADITLNATGPDPATLTGHGNGTTITMENGVGQEIGISFDSGLFVPNTGTPVPTSIATGGTATFKLGGATAAAGKQYTYSWGSKRDFKSGTIKIS